MTIGNVPPSVAIPLRRPEGERLTPLGRVPVSLNVGLGKPVAVAWKLPFVPAVKVVLFELVICGASSTVRVKFWLLDPITLVAVIMKEKIPLWVGIPLSKPLVESPTPLGKVPVSLNVGDGKPEATTWKPPFAPVVNVSLSPLVIRGAAPTVRVKFCEASLPTPLDAVKTRL
jgi:hypothetical protein